MAETIEDRVRLVRGRIEKLKADLRAATAEYSDLLTKIVAEERGYQTVRYSVITTKPEAPVPPA